MHGSYGDVGLLVVRLRGHVALSPQGHQYDCNNNSIMVTRSNNEKNFLVLQKSYQCIPLIRFATNFVTAFQPDLPGNKIVHEYHSHLQKLCDNFFNGHFRTVVDAPSSSPTDCSTLGGGAASLARTPPLSQQIATIQQQNNAWTQQSLQIRVSLQHQYQRLAHIAGRLLHHRMLQRFQTAAISPAAVDCGSRPSIGQPRQAAIVKRGSIASKSQNFGLAHDSATGVTTAASTRRGEHSPCRRSPNIGFGEQNVECKSSTSCCNAVQFISNTHTPAYTGQPSCSQFFCGYSSSKPTGCKRSRKRQHHRTGDDFRTSTSVPAPTDDATPACLRNVATSLSRRQSPSRSSWSNCDEIKYVAPEFLMPNDSVYCHARTRTYSGGKRRIRRDSLNPQACLTYASFGDDR